MILIVFLPLGCAPQALPPQPTRTPLPTFTPTAEPTPTALRPPEAPTPLPHEARLFLPSVMKHWWTGRVPAEGRFILVDQGAQQMLVYEDGVLVKAIPCSTGIPGLHETPAWSGTVGEYWGTFFADGLYADDAWFLFQHRGSILIHSLPYTLEAGMRLYEGEEALGKRPSSHGCIRIHPEDARWLKAWNPAGVPIVITPWNP
ncbi:MAG: L,D-transpeptidase family protein [Anaerolineae bacterium]